MRDGIAKVTVTLSDKRIRSPILNAYDTANINQQSLDIENAIQSVGLLTLDPNGINHPPS